MRVAGVPAGSRLSAALASRLPMKGVHVHSRRNAVGAESSSSSSSEVSGVAVSVAGMAAHNRRLAGVWHLGDPGGSAAPLTKWQVPKDSAELFCAVIERDWKDGELPVRHPVTGKVKATFRGFSIYGNTRQPHDAAKQAASTIVFEGGANFTIFRNGVPGFAPIESALLKHAEKWCVRWPHLLHGPGSVLSASCHTATPLFVRVKQPYFAWAVLVRQGPDFEGATDLDWHQDWRPPSDKDPKATRSVLTYAVKLNNGASSVELPDGRYAYNKAAGSVVCFHSKAYHRVLAGMTATKTLKLLLHVCDGSLFGDPYAYPELPVLSTEGKAPSALPVDRRGNKTSRSSIDGRLQWGDRMRGTGIGVRQQAHPAVWVARRPPFIHNEPSVQPLSRVPRSNTHSSLPFGPKLNMALWTCPVWPRRMPAEPRGWKKCVYMVAPLDTAHAMTALATLSALTLSSCHELSSRALAGRPTAWRNGAATAPLNLNELYSERLSTKLMSPTLMGASIDCLDGTSTVCSGAETVQPWQWQQQQRHGISTKQGMIWSREGGSTRGRTGAAARRALAAVATVRRRADRRSDAAWDRGRFVRCHHHDSA